LQRIYVSPCPTALWSSGDDTKHGIKVSYFIKATAKILPIAPFLCVCHNYNIDRLKTLKSIFFHPRPEAYRLGDSKEGNIGIRDNVQGRPMYCNARYIFPRRVPVDALSALPNPRKLSGHLESTSPCHRKRQHYLTTATSCADRQYPVMRSVLNYLILSALLLRCHRSERMSWSPLIAAHARRPRHEPRLYHSRPRP
jgi:hypothetical protein